MDSISGLITRINLESRRTSQTSPSKSNTTKQEPPDITNAPTVVIPPPHFMNSINELRSFSAALSAFISRYDELQSHVNFINSSIDSKLPNHLVDCATNPNRSALTRLSEICCDHTITAFPEVIVSEQNPNQSASDCERSDEIATTPDSISFSHDSEEVDTSMKLEVADESKNPEEIDVSENPVETDTSKDPEEIDASKKLAETDTSKKHEQTVPETSCDQTVAAVPEAIVSEQNPSGMATNCEQSLQEINESKKPEQTDICKNPEETVVLKIPEELHTSMNPEEIDTSKNRAEIDIIPEQTDICKNPEETVVLKMPEELDTSMNPEEIDTLKNPAEIDIMPEQTDTCKNPEETVVLNKPEELDTSMIPEEIDASKKHEETFSETSCDQTTPAVPEAIASEQNPNRIGTNHELSHETVRTTESLEEVDVLKKPAVIDTSRQPEQTDICKNPEENDILKKPEQTDICTTIEEIVVLENPEELDTSMIPEEIDASNIREEIDASEKPEETVPETSCDQTTPTVPEAIVSEHNLNSTATNCEQSPDQTDFLKKPSQTEICKNPEDAVVLKNPEELDTLIDSEEINTPINPEELDTSMNLEAINALKNQEEIDTSKMSVVSELEYLCQSMRPRELKWHVANHLSEMINLRDEIAKALTLAEDPAKLVLSSIGRFFMQGRRAYRKGLDSHKSTDNLGRMAAVLILECFVMISSDVVITERDREYAAEEAVDWRNRIIKEGGFGQMDEVDARGLLLFISGFGIQDHVFKIQDLMDLIRAGNWKEISNALRRSVSLIPKIPWVICLMVKSNLEVEAVDVAYTFELEAMCHPREILTKYLHNKIKEFQNASSFQMLEAVEQHLFDLKSVKQCLESHNVDPSTLLPNFKINEKIQNLEKEVNAWKLIQKRKSLENPIQQEPKRACFSHENSPRQQKPVDHHGMNRFNQSTQPSTSYFDPEQNHGNSCITNQPTSPVYNASAMPENIPGPVPNGLVAGLPGSSDQTVHTAEVHPNGWHGPYDQRFSRHGQTYGSQPYIGPWERGQLESFPGFLGSAGPSSDLYSFADIVERECMR